MSVGGGGGGGGYTTGYLFPPFTSSYVIAVGAGGLGGLANNPGADGTGSNFGSLIFANAGKGGTTVTAPFGYATAGGDGGQPSFGCNAVVSLSGNAGSAGITLFADKRGVGGQGGTSGMGGGSPVAAVINNGDGANGVSPGGGGNGALVGVNSVTGSRNGGNGAHGCVMVTAWVTSA